MKVSMLDSKKKQWEEDVAIDLDIYLPCDYVMDGVDCDFCYKGSDGIYGYDLVSKEYKEIIDYGASYMMNVDTDGMINVGENRFVGKTEHFVDNVIQITLVSYEKKDENAVTSKQKITLGTMYPGNDLKSAIAKYNRSNADYEVVIEDYSDMEMDRLLADFVSGKGQDIIDMNTFPLSVAQCVSKGMLEDLSPYYDSDEELSMDDLMESVRRAMEYNDKIYYLASSFSIQTIAVKKEDVGDCTGWSVLDLKALMDSNAKSKDLFSIKDIKEGYLYLLTFGDFSDYVDWENGSCCFDSKAFKYILELCDEKGLREEHDRTMEDVWEEVDSKYSRLQNSKYLLLEENEMNLNLIQFERKAIKSELAYVGCPNEAKNGSMFTFDNRFAISSQSNHKEQAWRFIRTFLLKEYQRNIDEECGMPITQDMFEAKLKEMTTTESYVNEFGDVIEPVEEYSMKWGDIEVKMGIPNQKDIDVYMNLINNTKRCADHDEVIYNIMMEEISDYFDRRRQLDETVEIVQKRVTTYINEQK